MTWNEYRVVISRSQGTDTNSKFLSDMLTLFYILFLDVNFIHFILQISCYTKKVSRHQSKLDWPIYVLCILLGLRHFIYTHARLTWVSLSLREVAR